MLPWQKLPIDTRLQQTDACMDKLHVAQRQLMCMFGQTTPLGAAMQRLRSFGSARATERDTNATRDALDELSAQMALMEGLAAGLTGMLSAPGNTLASAGPQPVFSDIEHRTNAQLKRLVTRFSVVKEASEASLRKARVDFLDPLANDKAPSTPPIESVGKRGGPKLSDSDSDEDSEPIAPNQVGRRPSTDAIKAPPTASRKAPPPVGRRAKEKVSPPVIATAADATEEGHQLLELHEPTAEEMARHQELQAVVAEAKEVRGVQEEMARLVAGQGERLNQAETNATRGLDQTIAGREQLSMASKAKLGAVWIGGALIGGLIGGPVGLLAGAKTASVICASAALGATGGALVSETVSHAAHRANTDVPVQADTVPSRAMAPKGDEKNPNKPESRKE